MKCTEGHKERCIHYPLLKALERRHKNIRKEIKNLATKSWRELRDANDELRSEFQIANKKALDLHKEKCEIIGFLIGHGHPLAPNEPLVQKIQNIVGTNDNAIDAMQAFARDRDKYKNASIKLFTENESLTASLRGERQRLIDTTQDTVNYRELAREAAKYLNAAYPFWRDACKGTPGARDETIECFNFLNNSAALKQLLEEKDANQNQAKEQG